MSSATTVTILGSGTCVPSLKRSSCSVKVVADGKILVMDTGPGTMRRLLETGTTIFDVSYLLYSHLHPDHTGELVPLLFATKYPDTGRRRDPLTILAGTGFENFLSGLRGVYGDWIDLPDGMVTVTELNTTGKDRRVFEGFTVETLPMAHRPESLGYRITGSDGRVVVYSGDTDVCESLITLAKGADVLICESALPDALKVAGHLSPSLAGEIAASANVRKLVLTHFYPECDGVDVRKECRKTFDGELFLAEDLMQIGL